MRFGSNFVNNYLEGGGQIIASMVKAHFMLVL